MKVLTIFSLLIFYIFTVAEPVSQGKTVATSSAKDSVNYQIPKGALKEVMFGMFANILEIKEKLEKNQSLGNLPDTLVSTYKGLDETKLDKKYFDFDLALQKSIQELYKSKNEKTAFNKIIENCVSCHSIYAPQKITIVQRLVFEAEKK